MVYFTMPLEEGGEVGEGRSTLFLKKKEKKKDEKDGSIKASGL